MATVWADIEAMTPTDAERKLIAASRMGKPCILGNGRPNPPDPGQAPDPARTIRAPILRYLILGGCEARRVHERGVTLVGAAVDGPLDLSFATARGMTWLIQCWFSSSVVAVQACLQALAMSGSDMPGLNAQAANVVGDVILREGFISNGEVNLSGSTIGGQLSCRGGKFNNPTGHSLNGQGLQATGGVFLDRGFEATGEVRLSGSTIRGQLGCNGGSFSNPEGYSLNGQGLQVSGDIFLGTDFKANGEVSLAGSIVAGQIGCRDGIFFHPKGCSLNGQGVRVAGSVFLDGGFSSDGEVTLSGATIGGQLNCRGGRFCITKHVPESPGEGYALNGQSLKVTGGVFLADGFAADGEVTLSGATIGGQLNCGNGVFHNPKGRALNGQGFRVGISVFFNNNFTADGEILLSGSTIGGQLTCVGGIFRNRENLALNAQKMRVSDGFLWRGVKELQGRILLTSAHVGDLVDDMQSWPNRKEQLSLDGFTYGCISVSFTDSKSRLRWLQKGTVRKGEFFPQPYAQLAKVLREMGHDRAARDVLVEQTRLIRKHSRERARRSAQCATGNVWSVRLKRLGVRAVNAGRRIWDDTQRWVVGYGYKPYRSLWFFLGLWAGAALLGSLAWNSDAMVPASDVVLTSPGWQAVAPLPDPAVAWTAAGAAGEDWETFNSLAWGFDVVVPVLSLGQTEAWAPSAARGPWGWLAWWGRGVLSVLGWVVVGLAAAAVTGLIRRE